MSSSFDGYFSVQLILFLFLQVFIMAEPIAPLITLNNGKKIPSIGLGTWKSKPGEVKKAVKYALMEAGYRHIDCAYIYHNEAEIGQAIKETLDSGKLRRDEIFITSKCWNSYHSEAKVMECCKKSLKNLNLDYVDLYLIHWPMGFQEGGEDYPLDGDGIAIFSNIDYLETWKGMEAVHEAGLAKSIGLSNFNSQQVSRVLDNCNIKPVINQIEIHPYLNQSKLIESCKSKEIALTAHSPLGSPDRPSAKPDDPSLLDDPKIKKIANEHDKSPAQIILRFGIQRGLILIPKSVTPSRIAENIQIFDFELTDEQMKSIQSLNRDWRSCCMLKAKTHPLYPFNKAF